MKLVKPEVIHQPPPTVVTPAVVGATFAQRRKALENMHRQTDTVKRTSPFIAKPDIKIDPSKVAGMQSIEEIEQSLGIEEEVKNG